MEDFIEYKFNQIIEKAVENKKIDFLTIIFARFWTFEIFLMKNYVKSMYLMKQHKKTIQNIGE